MRQVPKVRCYSLANTPRASLIFWSAISTDHPWSML